MAYRKSAETRKRILDTSEKLFREKGYSNTYIKDIAREAGIGHPVIYYYFKNKEDIVRILFDDVMEQITDCISQLNMTIDDSLLVLLVEHILVFKHIAFDRVTQFVYFDIIKYSDYSRDRLKEISSIYFQNLINFLDANNIIHNEKEAIAYLVTSDGFAKSLFRGIITGALDYTFEEAVDYFFRNMLLSRIEIDECEFNEKLRKAFKICNNLSISDRCGN